MYLQYLPPKRHPWVYVSLEIEPQNIDVNIHPTKHEVRFAHETTILEKLRDAMFEKLEVANRSRTFYIEADLPPTDFSLEALRDILPEDADGKKVYDKNLVRVSANDQKLERFNFTLNKSNVESDETIKNSSKAKEADISSSKNIENIAISDMDVDEGEEKEISTSKNVENIAISDMGVDKEISNSRSVENITVTNVEVNDKIDQLETGKNLNLNLKKIEDDQHNEPIKENTTEIKETNENLSPNSEGSKTLIQFKSYSVNEIQIETKLLSVLTLRKEVEDNYHDGLRYVCSNLVFVGCANDKLALIQSGTKLFMCETQKLA